jgi:hypothetical protein
MLSQLVRHLSITSTKFYLFLAGASAIFVYFLSPTRESVYQLIGANLGLRLWWLDDLPMVPEEHKMLAAFHSCRSACYLDYEYQTPWASNGSEYSLCVSRFTDQRSSLQAYGRLERFATLVATGYA